MMKKRNNRSVSHRRAKQQRQKNLSIGLALGGVVIIVVGLIAAFGGEKSKGAEILYKPEDVVTDAPFVAIHEMTPPTISEINFLSQNGPQPKIAVSETFYDFGSIGPTAIARHAFIITNQGDAPLTIYRAYTTCGCTTAEFSSSVIPPGKVVVMTLILDAGFHDVRGQTVRRGVIIENNDPENSQIEIWSQAKVKISD